MALGKLFQRDIFRLLWPTKMRLFSLDPRYIVQVSSALQPDSFRWISMPPTGEAAHHVSEQPSERASAVGPDLVDDLHSAKGLPEEQRQHAHVQAHMGLAGNQIATLHQW